jgi:hypothetical protein
MNVDIRIITRLLMANSVYERTRVTVARKGQIVNFVVTKTLHANTNTNVKTYSPQAIIVFSTYLLSGIIFFMHLCLNFTGL